MKKTTEKTTENIIHKTQKNDKQITNYVQTNDRLILHWVAPSILESKLLMQHITYYFVSNTLLTLNWMQSQPPNPPSLNGTREKVSTPN